MAMLCGWWSKSKAIERTKRSNESETERALSLGGEATQFLRIARERRNAPASVARPPSSSSISSSWSVSVEAW